MLLQAPQLSLPAVWGGQRPAPLSVCVEIHLPSGRARRADRAGKGLASRATEEGHCLPGLHSLLPGTEDSNSQDGPGLSAGAHGHHWAKPGLLIPKHVALRAGQCLKQALAPT